MQRRARSRVGILGLCAVMAAVAPRTSGAGEIWDQTNVGFTQFITLSITLNSPVGQQFVPQLNRIDFAEVNLEPFDNHGDPSRFVMEIYRGSQYDGPLLGVSDTVDVPGLPLSGVTRFEFRPGVILQRWVIQTLIVRNLGTPNWGIRFDGLTSVNTYLPGAGIANGHEVPGDLWFREGAEEDSVAAVTKSWGAVKSAYR